MMCRISLPSILSPSPDKNTTSTIRGENPSIAGIKDQLYPKCAPLVSVGCRVWLPPLVLQYTVLYAVMVVWDVCTVHGYTVECRWDVFNLWLFGMFVPYSSVGCLYRLAVFDSTVWLYVDLCTVWLLWIFVPFLSTQYLYLFLYGLFVLLYYTYCTIW